MRGYGVLALGAGELHDDKVLHLSTRNVPHPFRVTGLRAQVAWDNVRDSVDGRWVPMLTYLRVGDRSQLAYAREVPLTLIAGEDCPMEVNLDAVTPGTSLHLGVTLHWQDPQLDWKPWWRVLHRARRWWRRKHPRPNPPAPGVRVAMQAMGRWA